MPAVRAAADLRRVAAAAYAPIPYSAPTPITRSAATVAGSPTAAAPRRSTSYYVLLGLAGLALFAISMFVTILLLQ